MNKAISRAVYWRRCRRLTGGLLFVWFALSFTSGYYARQLDAFSLCGFPLGFYLAAQGAPIVYLAIVGVYAWAMDRLDAAGGVGDDD